MKAKEHDLSDPNEYHHQHRQCQSGDYLPCQAAHIGDNVRDASEDHPVPTKPLSLGHEGVTDDVHG